MATKLNDTKIVHIMPDDKKKMIEDFLARVAPGDSLVLIATHNMPHSSIVQSETCTFIYPNHLTGMRNTCNQLADNLEKARIEDENSKKKNEN